MRRAIAKYRVPFTAILVLGAVAAAVGTEILSHQRVFLPKWVPWVGSDVVEYRAELASAQSIMPGQGQTVTVAGVRVGDIASVDLIDGRALVTMKIRRKHTPLYRDASIVVRPTTPLNDMVLELDPGSRAAGEHPREQPIPVSRTIPNLNPDEVLAALDADTRAYLQLLVGAGGEGLGGEGERLASALRRLDPTARAARRIFAALSERRASIRRTVHNLRELSEAIGGKDAELAALVASSDAVLRSLAERDAEIREAVDALPGTLRETDTALAKADRLGRELGPTLDALRPAARKLGPTLRTVRPFLRDTTPIVRDRLRPFAREALPLARDLRPAVRDLARATPDLRRTVDVLNVTLDTLAYDRPGDQDQSFLFWLSWANHITNSMLSAQDAHGPIRRGIVQLSCSTMPALLAVQRANPQLGTLLGLLNAPVDACPRPGAPAAAARGAER
jgi:phospholipid/cholesterol/gamma-HCH transport system substrate-binding protein